MSAGWKAIVWGAAIVCAIAAVLVTPRARRVSPLAWVAVWAALLTLPFFWDAANIALHD